MTRFVDGPAAGQVLFLRRAPLLLRAVREQNAGEWDALDQLLDEPKATEDVVVYRRVGEPSTVHICGRGRGAHSGWYQAGEYHVVDPQPAADVLRDTAKWRESARVTA